VFSALGVVAGVDDLLLRWQRGSGLARVWWTAQDSGRDKPKGGPVFGNESFACERENEPASAV
jgi:hypothetical protein